HERLDQPHLLPVAFRQAADLLVEIEVESLGETFDAVPADATAEVPQVGQELACRLVAVDREVARQVSDTPSQLHALGAGIEPQHGDLAGVGAEEVQEEAYRRRLAGAVGAEEPEYLAPPHLQIQVVERQHGAVALGE